MSANLDLQIGRTYFIVFSCKLILNSNDEQLIHFFRQTSERHRHPEAGPPGCLDADEGVERGGHDRDQRAVQG